MNCCKAALRGSFFWKTGRVLDLEKIFTMRKMIQKVFLFPSLIFVIISCDCLTNKSGIIYDLQTGEPIADAIVALDNYSTKTDSSGRFIFKFVTGKCPDWKIKVTKENYKPFDLLINNKGNYTIYRLKNEYNSNTRQFLNSTYFTAINQDSIIIKLIK